jgi:hypothetical protein
LEDGLTLVGAAKADETAKAGQDGIPPEPRAAYASDTYSWAMEQAALLRAGRLDLIDAENIADEIADVGKTEARITSSAIRLVLQHLLKWDFQPSRRSRSWALTVREHRRGVGRQLRDNPGLRPQLPTLVSDAYADARDAALGETGLKEGDIPTACPYSWDDIMTRPIEWPEQP